MSPVTHQRNHVVEVIWQLQADANCVQFVQNCPLQALPFKQELLLRCKLIMFREAMFVLILMSCHIKVHPILKLIWRLCMDEKINTAIFLHSFMPCQFPSRCAFWWFVDPRQQLIFFMFVISTMSICFTRFAHYSNAIPSTLCGYIYVFLCPLLTSSEPLLCFILPDAECLPGSRLSGCVAGLHCEEWDCLP